MRKHYRCYNCGKEEHRAITKKGRCPFCKELVSETYREIKKDKLNEGEDK